ncbi:hypothetical protein CYMTET_5883 [Cymbomonas tetramitiformis]|uniref:Uncharacterized protein n=1 Tax=Cymbomonas tetramitiformis TaxID=36881 RepID=A0AAE0GY87_9CHLO|nr:hypothetical protein CYMTET_5883 [Cymbomonas tetramitiformis]
MALEITRITRTRLSAVLITLVLFLQPCVDGARVLSAARGTRHKQWEVHLPTVISQTGKSDIKRPGAESRAWSAQQLARQSILDTSIETKSSKRASVEPKGLTYYSQHGQDFWVSTAVFPHKTNGVFLQLVAHANAQPANKYPSNTFTLEKYYKWSGYRVEVLDSEEAPLAPRGKLAITDRSMTTMRVQVSHQVPFLLPFIV